MKIVKIVFFLKNKNLLKLMFTMFINIKFLKIRNRIFLTIISYLYIYSTNTIAKNNGIIEALNTMPKWHIATC